VPATLVTVGILERLADILEKLYDKKALENIAAGLEYGQ
jgi:hypothetical protein